MANPLGSAPGIMVGVGVGTAGAAAIEPLVEPGRQKAWRDHPNQVLDPGLYARLVAQGAIDIDVGRPLARRSGFNEDQFNRLVHLAQSAPDLADTLELWRRKKISESLVDHALAKAQIEHQYWDGLKELFNARLSPQVAALAIVRGIMKDPGFLPVGPPLTEGKVKAFPVSPLDPLYEAQGWGYDKERMFVETAISGRPAPPNESARAVFRSILERVDFDRAISEGDIRNEWADTLFEVAREILTANQYAELQLRGFLTPAQRKANTDKHGMSEADSDLLYNLLGRSIPVHQITTGEARGGTFDGAWETIPKAYLSSLQRGNLRPEFYNLAFHNRYSYPSAFFFRILIQNGEITADQGRQAFEEVGWSPKWAKLIADALAPVGPTAKENPYIGKAQTQLWNAIHKGYTKGANTQSDAESALSMLIPDATDRAQVFLYWDEELALLASPPPPA